MSWNGTLVPFFWILLLAFAFQTANQKIPWLRIPSIISNIILGMVIGNGGFQFIDVKELQWVNGIGQFGLFFLMFLSGLEFDLQLIKPQKNTAKNSRPLNQNPIFLSAAIFCTTLILSFGLSLLMAQVDHRIKAWMMMLILSTTSLGIVLPVLKEKGYLKEIYGQTILTTALVADFVTMLAISTAADVYKNSFSWNQLLVGLFFPLILISYFAIARFQKSRFWNSFFGTNTVTKSQAVFALLGLFGVVSDFTGTEPILGSFLAGFLLSCFRLGESNRLRQNLEIMGYSFVIPIFFVMVGMRFSLASFLSSKGILEWVFFLLVSAYAVKILPMLWFGQSFGSKAAFAGGILLSSRMILVLVASSIAIQLGIIPPYINEAMLVVAILTCTVSPILFSLIAKEKENHS